MTIIQDAILWFNLHYRNFWPTRPGGEPLPESQVMLLQQVEQGSVAGLVGDMATDEAALRGRFLALHRPEFMTILENRVRSGLPSLAPELRAALVLLLDYPTDSGEGAPDLALAALVCPDTTAMIEQGIVTSRESWLKLAGKIIETMRNHLTEVSFIYPRFPQVFMGRRHREEQRGDFTVIAVENIVGSACSLAWTPRPEDPDPLIKIHRHRDDQPAWIYYCRDLLDIRAELMARVYADGKNAQGFPFVAPILSAALGDDRSAWPAGLKAFSREQVLAHEEGHHASWDRTRNLGSRDVLYRTLAKTILDELYADRFACSRLRGSNDHDWRLWRAFEGVDYLNHPERNETADFKDDCYGPGNSYFVLKARALWEDDPVEALDETITAIEDFAWTSRSEEDFRGRLRQAVREAQAALRGKMDGLAGALGD